MMVVILPLEAKCPISIQVLQVGVVLSSLFFCDEKKKIPNLDPLFYLHHANLDRIWWDWQQINPSTRLYEVSGRSTITPPFHNITLDFGLDLGSFAPIMPIREVMDIHSGPMCYTYV